MTNILSYLDNQIEFFKQKNGDYPNLILMNKETKDKLFTELKNDVDISLSWVDHRDNYRGIEIKISDVDFVKLEG